MITTEYPVNIINTFGKNVNSQLIELLGGDDDRVLACQGHQAAVVVPEGVLHAGNLAHDIKISKFPLLLL